LDVRLLGSGGWMPTDARETACLYVRDGDRVLLVDAGTGLRRIRTDPELLEGVGRVDVVLTHFHLDHVVGLSYLPGLEVRVDVWAGGRVTAGEPSLDLVHRLLDPPFLLREARDVADLFGDVRELEPPGVEIGPFRVDVRVQRKHPSPTLALRVNGALAHCTDTAYDEENVEFVRGAGVLLHEAFHAADTTDDEGHTASGEAGRLAAAAGVGRLVLIHPGPLTTDEEALLSFARRHFPAAELGRDGMRIELDL
jgi:ribonuclease BN (tRNA processing enzyme)